MTRDAFPLLFRQGFQHSPFASPAWGGRDNLGGHGYRLFRLQPLSVLECVQIYVPSISEQIDIELNSFILEPALTALEDLNRSDGMKFLLPPCSLTNMTLCQQEYRFIPVITPLFYRKMKLGKYRTESGFQKEVDKLKRLVVDKLLDMDVLFKRWHVLHQPVTVDWDGNVVGRAVQLT